MPLLLLEHGESSSATDDVDGTPAAADDDVQGVSSGVIGGEVSRDEQLLPAKLPAPLSTSS